MGHEGAIFRQTDANSRHSRLWVLTISIFRHVWPTLGVSSLNCAFLDENVPTRRRFSDIFDKYYKHILNCESLIANAKVVQAISMSN